MYHACVMLVSCLCHACVMLVSCLHDACIIYPSVRVLGSGGELREVTFVWVMVLVTGTQFLWNVWNVWNVVSFAMVRNLLLNHRLPWVCQHPIRERHMYNRMLWANERAPTVHALSLVGRLLSMVDGI